MESNMFKNANFFISEFFRSLIGKQPTENITPKIAVAIQRQDFFNSQNQFEQTYTPPYVLIGYQLFNDKIEIFEASVHYLYIIALNMPQYKNDIVAILSSYIRDNKKFSNRIKYIENKLSLLNTQP